MSNPALVLSTSSTYHEVFLMPHQTEYEIRTLLNKPDRRCKSGVRPVKVGLTVFIKGDNVEDFKYICRQCGQKTDDLHIDFTGKHKHCCQQCHDNPPVMPKRVITKTVNYTADELAQMPTEERKNLLATATDLIMEYR